MKNQKQETVLTNDTISIILENNEEVMCDILAIFPLNDKFYVALLPQKPIPEYEECEYFLYQYISDGENVELLDIENDEEWELVEDRFEELLDEEEFNQLEDR